MVLSLSRRLCPNQSGEEAAGDEVAGDEVAGDEVVGEEVAATPRKLILPASEPLWYRM